MNAAPRTTSVIISGPVGGLELSIDAPGDQASETQVKQVAVICHPHPLFGGNMHNKVTHILARACNDLVATAVRFNFRGVGKSAGTHDDGNGEVDDVLAVLTWVERQWPNARIWLAGFSFGAAMALRAALRDAHVQRLITVAPALRWLQQLEGAMPSCPWLVVQGDQDELVDVAAVRGWVESLPQPPTLTVLAGAEHFFHGRLSDLRQVTKEWLQA